MAVRIRLRPQNDRETLPAEVRSFADCARYVLTTLMDLQAPAPAGVSARYHSLFASVPPDTSSTAGKVALLNAFKATLKDWAALLCKFCGDEEDQFEMLLTLEEYCGCKGVFAGGSQVGRVFVPIFSHVLLQLRDNDVIADDVFLQWEQAKLDDDDDDQVRPCPPCHVLALLSIPITDRDT